MNDGSRPEPPAAVGLTLLSSNFHLKVQVCLRCIEPKLQLQLQQQRCSVPPSMLESDACATLVSLGFAFQSGRKSNHLESRSSGGAEGSKGLHGGGGAFGRIRLLAAPTALEGYQEDGLKLRETLLKHQRCSDGHRRSQRSPGGRASRSTSARRERSSFPRNSVSCVI